MANVQLENGFVRIASELLEKVIKTPFIATQLKIILLCWRYTYGYNRKQADLSESFISKATGISKRYISKELKTLIDCKVLRVVKESTFTTSRIFEFNKNFDEWEYRTTVPLVNDNSTGELQSSTTVEPQFNTTVELQFHQDTINTKTNKKINEHEQLFEKLWQLYPNKKGKASVKAKQKKILFGIGFEVLNKCIDRYKSTKEDWKAWQHGSTFFNSGYVDYLDSNYQGNDSKEKSRYQDLSNYMPEMTPEVLYGKTGKNTK
jgi:phage replication O-like protein O